MGRRGGRAVGAASVVVALIARTAADARRARRGAVGCHGGDAHVTWKPQPAEPAEPAPVAAVTRPPARGPQPPREPFWFEPREPETPMALREAFAPSEPLVASLEPAPAEMPEPERLEPEPLQPEPEPPPAAPARRARPYDQELEWAPWGFEVPATAAALQRPRSVRTTSARATRASRHTRSRRRHSFSAHGARLLVAALLLGGAGIAVLSLRPSPPASASSEPARYLETGVEPRPSPYALRSIPSSYLRLYWRVGQEYGLDWTKLAAVGQIESDQGRSVEAGVASGTNAAGAAGPAQFLSSTWARYGVDADGRGAADPHDPVDAITSMAAYLKAVGAPESWTGALYAYNHSESYVQSVLALSQRYDGNA